MVSITLQDAIRDSGKTITYICKKMGRSRRYLYTKWNTPTLFTVEEVNFFCEELNLTPKQRDTIFLLSR